ncbi:MAG: hypothetical protein GWP06_00535 [Actinobacteria bacterium]|nr:hypothetical protein [Actinomycetota bacterium]
MPIHKYKTFAEAEQALWNFHPDDAYYSRLEELWDFADRLCPIHYPRGIFKFRTIEEANKHREEFELEHALKMLAERKSKQKK